MRRTAGLIALAGVLLAGCGSSTLSTRELRRDATNACTLARARTNRIATPPTPAGGAAFLAQGIAALAPELRALRTLHAPRDLASVYATSVSAFASKLAALRASSHALAAGGDPVIAFKTLAQRLSPLQSQQDGAWRALEIPACEGG